MKLKPFFYFYADGWKCGLAKALAGLLLREDVRFEIQWRPANWQASRPTNPEARPS